MKCKRDTFIPLVPHECVFFKKFILTLKTIRFYCNSIIEFPALLI